MEIDMNKQELNEQIADLRSRHLIISSSTHGVFLPKGTPMKADIKLNSVLDDLTSMVFAVSEENRKFKKKEEQRNIDFMYRSSITRESDLFQQLKAIRYLTKVNPEKYSLNKINNYRTITLNNNEYGTMYTLYRRSRMIWKRSETIFPGSCVCCRLFIPLDYGKKQDTKA